MAHALGETIRAALRSRNPLTTAGLTDALRLFHGRADGVDGLVIERLGPALVVQCLQGRLALPEHEVRAAVESLHLQLGTAAAYRKVFVPDRAAVPDEIARELRDPQPWIGRPVEPEYAIFEHPLRFLVRPFDGFSTGLFLEHRDSRRRVRQLAGGRRVLNLFSYTCGFSVAAAAGGAAATASVDLSRKHLEWGKRNFEANGLALEGHRFYCCDVFDFFARARRRQLRFDLAVLDPPTFSRTRRPARTFSVERQLPDLLHGVIDLLEPAGTLLLATNCRRLGLPAMEAAIAAAAGSRGIDDLEHLPLPPDFAGDPDYARMLLIRLAR